jgi:hypothetical protein
MKRYLFFLTVFTFIYETNVVSQVSNSWKTLVFKNYTIDVPADKRLDKADQQFALMLGEKNNITLLINDLAGYQADLDSYAAQYRQDNFETTNVINFVKGLQSQRITINNLPCQKFVVSWDDGHGEITHKQMTYLFVKNNWAYHLVFSAAPDKFDELKPIALKVMGSFKITKK